MLVNDSMLLVRNAVSGSIPSELFVLTAMSRLDIQNNLLIGSVPAQIVVLQQMTRPDL